MLPLRGETGKLFAIIKATKGNGCLLLTWRKFSPNFIRVSFHKGGVEERGGGTGCRLSRLDRGELLH